MNKNHQVTVLSLFITAALLGSLITSVNHEVFGTKNKTNEAAQGLGQNSTTLQDAECDSEANTLASCNNVALSFNLNDGSNALGQQ